MEQAQMQPEKRGVRRFSLNLPVKIKNGSSTADHELLGQTRDVSSRGAFVQIDSDLVEGANLEFTMTLPSEITLADPIRVLCHGRILRVEHQPPSQGIAVAIEKYDFMGPE